MGQKLTVAYYSTLHGVTQQQTGEAVTYYGKVFSIHKGLFSEDGDVDFQEEIAELIEEAREQGLEPILDQATVERYETWEMDGEKVWVMYRLPCKK